ncbi:TPA: hypothetical protein ACGO1T_000881 [Streptococcus suis]
MKQDIRNMIDAMEKLMNSMQELIYNYYAKCEPISAKHIKTINLDASNITSKNFSRLLHLYGRSTCINEGVIKNAKLHKEEAVEKAKLYEFDNVHWFSVAKGDGKVSIATHSDTTIFTGSFENGEYVKVGRKLYIVEDGDLKLLAEGRKDDKTI